MPGSYDWFNTEVTNFINSLLPSSGGNVLDVGPGAGKWGKFLKRPNRNIEAVEIHAPYVTTYNLKEIYNVVYVQDICTFWCTYAQYDLVILGDILEHLSVESSKKLLSFFEEKNIPVLVLVPYNYAQGESHGNPYERHLQPELTEPLFHQRYPGFIKIIGNDLQGVFYKDAKPFTEFKDFCKQTLILYTSFNRPEITELSLANLESTRRGASLWIFDDASNNTKEFLEKCSPKAQRIERISINVGINRLRCYTQSKAFPSEYKYMYHTDNDAIHDPFWLNRLYEMSKVHSGILSLYNSDFHKKWTVSEDKEKRIIIRSECPGVSFFYDKTLLESHKINFPEYTKKFEHWDFTFCKLINKKVAVSSRSFVEHFGAEGLHADSFEKERAVTPTLWLQIRWNPIINKLKKG